MQAMTTDVAGVPTHAYQTPASVCASGMSSPPLDASDIGCASNGGSTTAAASAPVAAANASQRRVAWRRFSFGTKRSAKSPHNSGAATNGPITGCSHVASAADTA